ncbi:Hypothetical protein SMAX5B_011368 [Scophthalmus maximus]|uniref:Uncharacterized protein n=1 Tax=Scophthalmus maximus TaxID=52904 RepID=A0A2U9BP11_SCOMX|nr:Hypothetical protein SMAX5B_011368 [Scophthalmus maximus]
MTLYSNLSHVSWLTFKSVSPYLGQPISPRPGSAFQTLTQTGVTCEITLQLNHRVQLTGEQLEYCKSSQHQQLELWPHGSPNTQLLRGLCQATSCGGLADIQCDTTRGVLSSLLPDQRKEGALKVSL